MKKVLICALVGSSAFLIASVAQAANLLCSGTYLGFDFTLAGQTKGAQVVSDCVVNIGQRGRVLKTVTLSPVASSVQPGVGIQLQLASAEGTGTLDTTFNNGLYTGRLVANTQYGTFRVPVTCKLADSIRRHPRRHFVSEVVPEVVLDASAAE